MDDKSDPRSLLEQKVARPLSVHLFRMHTTAERTRADLLEQVTEDTQPTLAEGDNVATC